MSFKLGHAIRLHKGIQSYKDMVTQYSNHIQKLRNWIRKDKKRLQTQIKSLSTLENIEFGLKTGHISKADYQIMKMEAKQ